MSTIFESLDLAGLRKTHLDQLLSYINERERTGWYYGNKKQFEKRHNELKMWIENAIKCTNKKDIVY